jgi:hypothetical protein
MPIARLRMHRLRVEDTQVERIHRYVEGIHRYVERTHRYVDETHKPDGGEEQ